MGTDLKYLVHVDGRPVGVFDTFEGAQAEGLKHTGTDSRITIERPTAPAPTKIWRWDQTESEWIETQ